VGDPIPLATLDPTRNTWPHVQRVILGALRNPTRYAWPHAQRLTPRATRDPWRIAYSHPLRLTPRATLDSTCNAWSLAQCVILGAMRDPTRYPCATCHVWIHLHCLNHSLPFTIITSLALRYRYSLLSSLSQPVGDLILFGTIQTALTVHVVFGNNLSFFFLELIDLMFFYISS
jgi:hypothetical protein